MRMMPPQATARVFQLTSILAIFIPNVFCRFVRFTWGNGLKPSLSYTDIYDINPAWMNTKCLNFPTPDPTRGLVAVEYYSGPPINPYHPYFLKAIIIFNVFDCPPPSANPRLHYLPLEILDKSEFPKHPRPKWLQTPNAQYLNLDRGGEEPGVIAPENWEDLQKFKAPEGFEQEPHWIDYSTSEAHSIDMEKMRTGISRVKGDEYVDQLARSLQDGQASDQTHEKADSSETEPKGYRESMEDSQWNIVYMQNAFEDSKTLFLGNISALLVPDYRYAHVIGLAREFDEYAKIGERVEGWKPPAEWKEEMEMEDEGLTGMGSPGWDGEEI
ncbi:hypothetical protein TWF225_010174 [Orbilia oligospora]|uniref:Uncharacterized protein n=1 Tax=Orbilia oligospora TaxID=2813651 RepID=A0A7C8PT00_ORBOL|nr:hypothetical protein TWF751_001431 [Orbilia oligospora]KAF3193422.1 hypothetical protein TWF225_010174 [Orbilia oligospora]KAF3240139.1 hypothetical protein TWF128_011396 [Orbilia oligospora]KAF3243372.1 hypothetical protein TWF217_011290 [Orbilia oligospora]KAF3296271.1 hypothetical protein TWF132_010875 [Orbilia oligospora]